MQDFPAYNQCYFIKPLLVTSITDYGLIASGYCNDDNRLSVQHVELDCRVQNDTGQLLLFIHQMSSNALLPHTAADEDDVGECKHDVTLTKSTTSVDSKAALKPEKAHMVSAPALNSIAALKST